jgi:hypothetical protein
MQQIKPTWQPMDVSFYSSKTNLINLQFLYSPARQMEITIFCITFSSCKESIKE